MERETINNIKSLGIDMIANANSGHPGIVLGAAPIIYTLYANHLHISTSDPLWVNRDRFVMSAGHGSALLYATLYMAGFDLTIDDLKNFRRIGSKTPGHPEYPPVGESGGRRPLVDLRRLTRSTDSTSPTLITAAGDSSACPRNPPSSSGGSGNRAASEPTRSSAGRPCATA